MQVQYVPSLASYLHTVESSFSSGRLNLQGIGIGDGLSDTPTQIKSMASYLYYHGTNRMRNACVHVD
jgi:hypothetical protein